MIDILKLISQKTCAVCNFNSCICPKQKEHKRTISSIKELEVKRKKWITTIYGDLEKSTFIYLKKYLGTGGTYQNNIISLRGKAQKRLKILLLKLNFKILDL